MDPKSKCTCGSSQSKTHAHYCPEYKPRRKTQFEREAEASDATRRQWAAEDKYDFEKEGG